jgi:hypothetical protein
LLLAVQKAVNFIDMKRLKTILIFVGLINACFLHSVLSQTKPDHFVGSTPCDPYIKSILKIDEQALCEFIKWKLDIDITAKTFTAEVLYGISLPNTNGFQNGGTKLIVNGRFELNNDKKTGKPIYLLSSASFKSPLSLREMDNNVLHVLGADNTLLVGNGGFSYSLNRQ